MYATFYLHDGDKFSNLTFIRELSTKERKSKMREGVFKCKCGKEVNLLIENVMKGRTKSCGCYNRQLTTERNLTHGLSKTAIYKKWSMIKYRCENPRSITYKDYGAKGITVSDSWQRFENFYMDMNESYQMHIKTYGRKNTTIERIDYKKGYSKENCRWATTIEQGNNTSTNKIFLWEGREYTMSNLARLVGLNPRVLQKRLKRGWDLDRAVNTPYPILNR